MNNNSRCKGCTTKHEDNKIETIPFAVHEAVVYVMERNIKRWMTVSALLFAVIVVMAVAIIK